MARGQGFFSVAQVECWFQKRERVTRPTLAILYAPCSASSWLPTWQTPRPAALWMPAGIGPQQALGSLRVQLLRFWKPYYRSKQHCLSGVRMVEWSARVRATIEFTACAQTRTKEVSPGRPKPTRVTTLASLLGARHSADAASHAAPSKLEGGQGCVHSNCSSVAMHRFVEELLTREA